MNEWEPEVVEVLDAKVTAPSTTLQDVDALAAALRDLIAAITHDVLVINAGVQRILTPALTVVPGQGEVQLVLSTKVTEPPGAGPLIRYKCHVGCCGVEVWGTVQTVAKHIVGHAQS